MKLMAEPDSTSSFCDAKESLTSPVSGADAAAINAVARDCGTLAIECSDVSGYVAGVAGRIAANLGTLDLLEKVTARLVEDQARVSQSTGEAQLLAEQAQATLTRGRAVIEDVIADFSGLTSLVVQLGDRMAGFAAAMEQVRHVSSGIEAIAKKTNLLAINATIEAARAGESGRGFVVVANEVKRLAEETRSATSEISDTVRSLTKEAAVVASEVRTGVERSSAATSGFASINDSIDQLEGIVASVGRQTQGIAGSAQHIEQSVDSMKGALGAFAVDARANGSQLQAAQQRLDGLETLSGTMLDRLAHCGVRIDDSRYVDIATAANRELEVLIENAIAEGLIATDDLFDTDYRPMPGTNPQQYWNRFCEFADAHVRPVLDRFTVQTERCVGCVISDANGYLPTHISRRCLPQGKDPAWNAEHSRNRCNFIDDALRRAIASERAMLVTYRLNLGEGRYLPVKNVFVPTFIHGRRWGNFELAYRDGDAD
jgi:methyl-accepting chemotaxis protein